MRWKGKPGRSGRIPMVWLDNHCKCYGTKREIKDIMNMEAPFYAQYIKEFGRLEEFNDVILQFTLVESKMRNPNTGLLYHGWDESRQQQWADKTTGCSPHSWGRGMGWFGMALVDVLDYIPQDYPQRDSLIAIANRMAKAIIKVQDEKTGTWYQILDQGDREGNYLEGSVSTMFTYFLLKAIEKQYIDRKRYMPYAKKAYKGIIDNLIKVEENGSLVITPVCAVAGLGGDEPYRDGSFEYYINEIKRDNDPKATGPFIMASLIYERINK